MIKCSCCKECKEDYKFYTRPDGRRNYYCNECEKTYQLNYRRSRKEIKRGEK